MKKILLTVLTVLTVSLAAPQATDTRECAKNFTFSGSFMAGRTYKTTVNVPNVTKKDAMDRASRLLTKDGWQITSKDTESGFISASQGVSYGQGKTVPLNVVVEQMNKGVEIFITYSTSGGVTSPTDAIIKQFCSIVAAVQKK